MQILIRMGGSHEKEAEESSQKACNDAKDRLGRIFFREILLMGLSLMRWYFIGCEICGVLLEYTEVVGEGLIR